MTSFGSPGGRQVVQKPIPPQRGSFPLDHDGECKHIMSAYLRCIRQQRGLNTPECRAYSKQYLTCRMDNNLMAPDDFSNLGFVSDGPAAVPDVPRPPGTPGAFARSSNSNVSTGRTSSSLSSSSTSLSSSPLPTQKQAETSSSTKTPASAQAPDQRQAQTSNKPRS